MAKTVRSQSPTTDGEEEPALKRDRELISEFLTARSDEAFREIVERYTDLVYGVCLRVLGDRNLAEDATQATFMVLLRRLETLRTDAPLGGWLHCVAERVARNMRKSKQRQERRESQIRASSHPDESRWDDILPELDGALASLPDVQRDAVVLRYLKGFSREQMAREMACPERTVDTRLTRALATLRQRLNVRGVSVSTVVLAGGLTERLITAAPAKLSSSIAAVCLGKGVASSAASAAAEDVLRNLFDSKARLRPRPRATASASSSMSGVIAATVVLAGGLLAWTCLAPSAKPAPTPVPVLPTANPIVAPTAQASAPAAAVPAFPLKVSGNGRYLVDQKNVPFPWIGEAANSAIVELNAAQMDKYLDDRAAKGFTVLQVGLLEHKFSRRPPENAAGEPPFSAKLASGVSDFTAPNEMYFRSADLFLHKAAERNMAVLLSYSHLGWNGGDEGWFQEMKANGSDRLRNWGQWLGIRYKDYANIIWQSGGDYTPAPDDRWVLDSVLKGMRDSGATQLMTAEGARTEIPWTVYGSCEWFELNNVFCNSAVPLQQLFRAEYARLPARPVFLIEALYEAAPAATPELIRRQAYIPFLAGGCGQNFGHEGLCTFEYSNLGTAQSSPAWVKDLDSPGSRDIARLASLLKLCEWWTLVPDSEHTLLIGDVRAAHAEIVAARSPDGKSALVYVPSTGANATEFTIAMNAMAGPVAAEWFNPTSGAFRTIQDSPLPNVQSRMFVTPGDNGTGTNDWLLVLSSGSESRSRGDAPRN